MALTTKQRLQKLLLYHVFFRIPAMSIGRIVGTNPYRYIRINDKVNLPTKPEFDHDDLDALMQVVMALKPESVLEFGTAHGNTVANICANTHARVYTINALPEQIAGNAITFALTKDEIGCVYRQHDFDNRVEQIYENTAELDCIKCAIPSVDLAIIDACHDFDFVINDFHKAMPCVRPGGIIMLHDTFPPRPKRHLSQSTWAAMRLRAMGFDIYHIDKTWWGIWQKPIGNNTKNVFNIVHSRFFPKPPTLN